MAMTNFKVCLQEFMKFRMCNLSDPSNCGHCKPIFSNFTNIFSHIHQTDWKYNFHLILTLVLRKLLIVKVKVSFTLITKLHCLWIIKIWKQSLGNDCLISFTQSRVLHRNFNASICLRATKSNVYCLFTTLNPLKLFHHQKFYKFRKSHKYSDKTVV